MYRPLLTLCGVLVLACSTSTVEPPTTCECGPRVCGRLDCGKSCGVCPDDGICSADGLSCTAALPIGSACSTDVQCGTGRFCMKNDQIPGGYCSRRCSEGDACPADSVCRFGPTGEAVCMSECTACRTAEGYACAEDACYPCVPDCDGVRCGGDGCGGECGIAVEGVPACDIGGELCSEGTCTFSFQRVTDLLKDRWDLAAFDLNGAVVLVGGRQLLRDVDGVSHSQGVAKVERYDTITKQFSTMPALPEPIARPHAVLLGSTIHVVGGTVDPMDRTHAESASTSFFRQNGQTWLKLSVGIPEPSVGGAAEALDGKVHLLPGESEAGPSKSLWIFESEAWTKGPDRTIARTLFATANDGQRLWVVGGWDGTQALNTVETYSAANGWEQMPPLKVAVASPTAVVADGRLFVFGGYDGPEHGDIRPWVQSIDLSTGVTQLLGTTWGNLLRQRPVRTRDGDVLLFGGTEAISGQPIPHTEVLSFLFPEP